MGYSEPGEPLIVGRNEMKGYPIRTQASKTCSDCFTRRPDRARFCSQACLDDFRVQGYCDNCSVRVLEPSSARGPLLALNGFCSQTCREESKASMTVPIAFRASCPEFAAAGCCSAGSRCYERHCVAEATLTHDLVVCCSRAHVTRLVEYLKSGELSGGLVLEVEFEQKPPTLAGKADAHSDVRLLGLRVVSKEGNRQALRAEAHAALLQDQNITRIIYRVYAVSCAVANEELALSSVLEDLLHFGTSALPRVCVIAFPVSLQQRLASDVKADTRLQLHPAQGADCCLGAVAFPDRTEVGVFKVDTKTVAAEGIDAIPCRAAFKLQEVMRRCADLWPDGAKTWTAADVGAAPGGWTSVLACSGAARVFAIDPAELSPTVTDLPGVEHIAKRVEQCTPELLARGVTLDAIVCDINATPRIAVDAVLALLPAAHTGTVLVITLKKFLTRAGMAQAVEEEVQRLRKFLGTSLRVLHLFSGGLDELTVVGAVTDSETAR